MLTDGDRIQLAPYLARIHAARAARPEAERAADRARQYLTRFRRDTTLWDRWFNRDGPTGLAYREARKVHRDAVASVARGEKQIETLYRSLDRCIGPMMPRIDRQYEIGSRIIDSCARAMRECRTMRGPIDTFVGTVQDATRNGRDEKARKDAETARIRYPGALVQARRASVAVKLAVDPVRDAVARSRVGAPSLKWDDTALNRLPRTAASIHDLQILVRELPGIRGMTSRLDGLRTALAGLRKRTAEAQRAAQVRARDRLIEESAS